jgi:hypothetical protein
VAAVVVTTVVLGVVAFAGELSALPPPEIPDCELKVFGDVVTIGAANEFLAAD